MTLVETRRDEFRKCLLFQNGRVLVGQPFRRRERGCERFGHDHVADAKSGKDRTRERAHIDGPPIHVEPLKRLQWPSTVVEFSVVVVLDNHRIPALSPFDQGKASIKSKNRTCWKLMRWCHKDGLGSTREFRRIHTLPIDRHRHQASASSTKDLFGSLVLRVFDCYRIAAVDKYPGDQIQGLLGAAYDNHFRRVAHHSSGAPQM